jgi:dienelactone hydrolase
MTEQSFHFPDKSSWRFDAILASEPYRAAIEQDIPPEMLVGSVRDALEEALRLNNVRFALDYAERQPDVEQLCSIGFSMGERATVPIFEHTTSVAFSSIANS